MFEEKRNRVSHKKKRERSEESPPQEIERFGALPVPLRAPQNERPYFRVGQIVWQSAVDVVFGLLEGGRLVRQVGPNDRPLERHEFENVEYSTQHFGKGFRW